MELDIEIVKNIITKLRNDLQRPLRILDLTQEYLCLDSNSLKFLATFSKNYFDLIFIFNLFDYDFEKNNAHFPKLIHELSEKSKICILKISSYAPRQRKNCKNTIGFHEHLNIFHYFEKISECDKNASSFHSKSILYFCSNHYWYANGDMNSFNSWTEISRERPGEKNPYTHARTRRYYFSESLILKHFQIKGHKAENNKKELAQEIDFLIQKSSVFTFLPYVLGFSIKEHEGWLLREKISGIRLSTAIAQGIDYDPKRLIVDILDQIVMFESHGLYHTDLRTWNIILSKNDRAFIIDYGAIKKTTRDILHPKKHVFFSFLILIYEIIHKTTVTVRHFSPMFINIKNYPPEYQAWLQGLLLMDFKKWSFKMFLKLFHQSNALDPKFEQPLNTLQAWLDKSEMRLNSPKYKINYLEKRFIKYFEQSFIKKLSRELKKYFTESMEIYQ